MVTYIASSGGKVGNDSLYTVYGSNGNVYTTYQGKYMVHCLDRWGKIRARELPANAKNVRAKIDEAISKLA